MRIDYNPTETKRNIRKYYEQLQVNKVGNLDEMDKFLEGNTLKTESRKIRKSEWS